MRTKYRYEGNIERVSVPEFEVMALLDDEMYRALYADLQLRVLELQARQGGGEMWRRVLSSPLPTVRSTTLSRLGLPTTFRETTEYDLERHIGSWEGALMPIVDRAWVRARFQVLPTETGVKRVFDGEIHVGVPVIAHVLERILREAVMVGTERLSRFMQRWIDQRRSTAAV